MLFTEIKALIIKDIRLEWRERYAFNGLLLYIVSTVFICYLSFSLQRNQLNPITWNTLLWIILLFTAVNATTKSFVQERQSRLVYYYTLVSPQAIILAKIIYNALLMLLIASIGLITYSIVLGNPVQDIWLFVLSIYFRKFGFSSSLTMVAGIAAKAENNTALTAVLSFPVVLPMLLMLIKLSKNAMDGLDWGSSIDELSVLIAINLIVIALSYLLFPYLWRA